MDGLRPLPRDGSERIEAFIGRKVMDVWADSGEHHEARQKSSPLLARAKRARAIGVAGCFVESKYPHVILDGPGHTWAQPDLLRRPTSAFRRKAKAVPVVRPGRQVSYNESGCGDRI